MNFISQYSDEIYQQINIYVSMYFMQYTLQNELFFWTDFCQAIVQ